MGLDDKDESNATLPFPGFAPHPGFTPRALGFRPSMALTHRVWKSIAECRELRVEDLIEALDGMPPDKLHCPALAIGALKDALAKWPRPDGLKGGGAESVMGAEGV